MNTAFRKRPNWPFLLGWLIVVLVVFIALFGKGLAPLDPQQGVFILRAYDGNWIKPPFPAFTVPGYPLGSDAQGRDLLSQLLWAVRPTMAMVFTVAGVRLCAGTAVGIASGWWAERGGRVLDTMISAALAVPVLLVALGVIASIGIESGILAFIVGLSLTGWADTARLVREQTRGIKGQMYVEAARALGQSDLQLILRHVLRQITPILWMLMAFEISNTLLVTATLGFLGYYLGGGVWFQIEDFAMQRIAGEPELGQMLAIAAQDRTRPEAMLFAGTVVFITLLGFNLLGEGLRRRSNREQPDTALDHFGGWLAVSIGEPLADWVAANARQVRGAAKWVLFLGLGSALLWWWSQSNPLGLSAPTAVELTGQNLWATERRDPQGTLTIDETGPTAPNILWTWEAPGGLSGGPAVDASGVLYVVGSGALYAVDPTGTLRWQASLAADPVGTPALSADGSIYVADIDGGLSAFDQQGQLLWRLPPAPGGPPALAGPIVGPQRTVYYPVEGYAQAVSPAGQVLWRADIPYGYISPTLRLDPAGERLIFEDILYNVQDGTPFSEATFNPLDRFMVGADGKLYLQEETSMQEWQAEGGHNAPSIKWNLAGFVFGFPRDSGVTRDGFVWLMFSSDWQDTRIVWADLKGNVLGQVILPQRLSRVFGVDKDSTIYVCGLARTLGATCIALENGSEEPKWQVSFGPPSGPPIGGALVAHRLYVTTELGALYAVGDE